MNCPGKPTGEDASQMWVDELRNTSTGTGEKMCCWGLGSGKQPAQDVCKEPQGWTRVQMGETEAAQYQGWKWT